MALNHIQSGKVIDYPNASGGPIASGTVVIVGTLGGVALTDIADGATGSVAIEEVFELPKATGAIAIGVAVYWDADGNPVGGAAGSGACTTTSTDNTRIGAAVQAALSGDAAVRVKLNA